MTILENLSDYYDKIIYIRRKVKINYEKSGILHPWLQG